MTKTLTEQWREGTLPEGYYYVLYADQGDNYPSCDTEDYDDIDYWNGCEWHYDDDPVVEVLAPVPSYTELTLMAGNYRLAKKALRDCYNEMKYWATMNHRCSKIFNHIKAALVEMEEVK